MVGRFEVNLQEIFTIIKVMTITLMICAPVFVALLVSIYLMFCKRIKELEGRDIAIGVILIRNKLITKDTLLWMLEFSSKSLTKQEKIINEMERNMPKSS